MSTRGYGLLVGVALPPLVLAAVGVVHPMHLTAATAERWRLVHLLLLPIFPTLALGPWLTVRREPLAVRWTVGVLGFVYAVYYTGLDLLAGVGAGDLLIAGDRGSIPVLQHEGNGLAFYGVWAYLLASVIAVGLAVRAGRARALPGAVIVIGAAVSFLDSHIYWPRGVLTMLALAVGWSWLVLVSGESASTSARSSQSV